MLQTLLAALGGKAAAAGIAATVAAGGLGVAAVTIPDQASDRIPVESTEDVSTAEEENEIVEDGLVENLVEEEAELEADPEAEVDPGSEDGKDGFGERVSAEARANQGVDGRTIAAEASEGRSEAGRANAAEASEGRSEAGAENRPADAPAAPEAESGMDRGAGAREAGQARGDAARGGAPTGDEAEEEEEVAEDEDVVTEG